MENTAKYTISIDILNDVYAKLFDVSTTDIDNPMDINVLTSSEQDNKLLNTIIKNHKVYVDLTPTLLTGNVSFKNNLYLIKSPRVNSIIESVSSEADIDKLNDMSYSYYGCKNLKVINKTPLAKKWEYAFSGCENITSIDVDLSYTKSSTNMFYDCINLERISDQTSEMTYNINTSKMFYNCKKLKTLMKMPKNVENVSYMYYKCNSLEDTDLTNYELPESITNMSGAFSSTNIVKGPHLLYSNSTIRDKLQYVDVFRDNPNLVQIWLPFNIKDIYDSEEETSLTEYTGIYYKCDNINKINTENLKDFRFSMSNWRLINDIFFDKYDEDIIDKEIVYVPDIKAEVIETSDASNNKFTKIRYAKFKLERAYIDTLEPN